MSEPKDQQERRHLQHEAEHAKPRKKVSVMSYLAILFAAAFLLLLLSYFMQQRNNEQTISGLQDSVSGLKSSVSAMQSVENLIENNQQLQEENDALQKQVADLEQQWNELLRENDSLRSVVESQDEWQFKNVEAMDWFWQLDEAYVLGKYTLCRSIIETMEDLTQGGSPLKYYLPVESTTDNKRFSPTDRYQEIYDSLY